MPNLITTPNNSFQYPSSANNGSNFSTGLQDFADDVDGMWSSGTLASRPAAGTRNRVYYATDTGLLYQDNGSAWSTVMLAGAWTNVSYATGWGTASGAYPLSYRQVGDRIELRGAVAWSSGGSGTVTTLPSGYRPASIANIGPALGGPTVSTAGVLTLPQNTNPYGFDGASFSLT